MLNFYTFGPLVVTLSARQGVPLAVRDSLTGADAQTHYPAKQIAAAISLARMAWEVDAYSFA